MAAQTTTPLSLHSTRRRRQSSGGSIRSKQEQDPPHSHFDDEEPDALANRLSHSLSLYDSSGAKRRQRRQSGRGRASCATSEKEEEKEKDEDTEEEDSQPIAGAVVHDAVPRFAFDALPPSNRPRALVLFAGAGFSSIGLALAGFNVTVVELDERKCYLHSFMKPAAEQIICADVLSLSPQFLQQFRTTWCSPPCQQRSVMRVSSKKTGAAHERGFDFVNWCLENTRHCDVVWIENVYNTNTIAKEGSWGVEFNAAQFSPLPLQCRQRLIGGKYPVPRVFRKHHRSYRRVRGVRFEPVFQPSDYRPDLVERPDSNLYNGKLDYNAVVTPSKREGRMLGVEPELCGVVPSLCASEYKCPMKQHPGNQNPYIAYRQFGSRAYGAVRIRLDQMARHFGLPDGIPEDWRLPPTDRREWGPCVESVGKWHEQVYEGLGNSVPIYMAFGFAQAALYARLDKSLHKYLQLDSPFVPREKPFPDEWVDTRHAKALQYD